MRLFMRGNYFWLLAIPLLFTGCKGAEGDYIPKGEKAADRKDRIVLGVAPSLPPTKLFTQFQPLADYLARKTGKEIVLSTAQSHPAYLERLKNGEYELIFPNPYHYILASKAAGYTPIAKVYGIPFQGLIVVRRDSGIDKISDLKGKKIAYPAPLALAATMQVRAYLKRQGIDPERDTRETYAASQESVIYGVHQRLFDAAGTWPEALEAIPDDVRRELKVLAETETLPHRPMAIRNDVPSDVSEKLKNAILGMKDDPEGRSILASIGYKGFEDTSDRDYDKVREWARKNGYQF